MKCCALAAVKGAYSQFKDLPDQFRCDREITAAAIRGNGSMLRHASQDLQEDQDLLLSAARTWPPQEYTEGVRDNRTFVLEAVRHNSLAYGAASRPLQEDLGVALAAVSNRTLITNLLPAVASHPHVVHAALVNHPEPNWTRLPVAEQGRPVNLLVTLMSARGKADILGSASLALKQDRNAVRCAVRLNGLALRSAHPALWEDEELATLCLAESSLFPEMLRVRSFLLRAVTRHAFALPESYLEDAEVVQQYVRCQSLPRLDLSRIDNRDVVLAAVRKDGMLLHKAPLDMWLDEEIFTAAAASAGLRHLLHRVDEGIAFNKGVCLLAVAADCAMFNVLGCSKHGRDFLLQALRASATPLDFATVLRNDDVLRDDEVRHALLAGPGPRVAGVCLAGFFADLPEGCDGEMLDVVRHTPCVFASLYSPARPCDSTDMALAAAHSRAPEVLALCSARLRSHRPLVLACIDLCGEALRWASPDLAGDRDVVARACASYPGALRFAATALKSDPEFVEGLVDTAGAEVLRHVPEVWGDERVASAAVAGSAEAMRGCAGWRGWCDDRGVMVRAVQRNPQSLRHASVRLRNDSDLAIMAVRCSSMLLCVGHTPRSDSRVVQAALRQDFRNITLLSPAQQADDEVFLCWLQVLRAAHPQYDASSVRATLLDAVADHSDLLMSVAHPHIWAIMTVRCSSMLLWIGRTPRSDSRVVQAAFRQDFRNITLLSPAQQADDEVFLCWLQVLRAAHPQYDASSVRATLLDAVADHSDLLMSVAHPHIWEAGVSSALAMKHSAYLQCIPADYLPALLQDTEFVFRFLAGVRGPDPQWAAPLRGRVTDRALVMSYAAEFGGILRYADEALRADREVVLACANRNVSAWSFLSHASTALRKDRAFLEEVMRRCDDSYYLLEGVSDDLRSDRAFVLEALSKGERLSQASDDLRRDPEVLTLVARCNPDSLCYALDETWRRAGSLLDRARRTLGCPCSNDPLNDRDTFLAAIKLDGMLLTNLPEHLLDAEMVQEAVLQNPNALVLAQCMPHLHGEVLQRILGSEEWARHVRVGLRVFPRIFPFWGKLTDTALALAVVEAEPLAWQLLPKELRDSHDFATKAFSSFTAAGE